MDNKGTAGNKGLRAGLDWWQPQPPAIRSLFWGSQLVAVAQSGSSQSTSESPSSSAPLSQISVGPVQAGSPAQSESSQSTSPSLSSSCPLSHTSTLPVQITSNVKVLGVL